MAEIMLIVGAVDACPNCGCKFIERVPRARWMKWLPHSKKWKCYYCNTNTLAMLTDRRRFRGRAGQAA